MKQFISNNKIALGIGIGVYLLFLGYSLTGSRICDCETTEKYGNSNSRTATHYSSNRFYHK